MAVFFSYLGSFALIVLIVGLFKPEWFKRLKLQNKKQIALAFGGAAILFGLVSYSIDPNATKTASSSENVTASSPTPTPTPAPTPAPHEIVVTSLIIKKVDGKYRYFFDVRNKDTKDFSGEVEVTVLNDDNNPLSSVTYNTQHRNIEPEFGGSFYIEAHTGPKSVHGEVGVSKYKFTAKIDGKTVKSGEGTISDKYEDLGF